MRIEVYRKYLVWRVRVVGANNKVIMNSEAYASRGGAVRAGFRASEAFQIPVVLR